MDIVFSTENELYERLRPALKSKVSELAKDGYCYLTEEDVWNYLKEKKWKRDNNLALNEMVDDILNSDNMIIDDYFKGKLNKKTRKIYFEEQ